MTTPVPTSSTDRGRPVTELTTRSPYQRTSRARGNFELWSWLFMRGSGVVLLVLVFGHLFVNLMLGEGIKAIDFAFVAGKWSSPFWQTWDLLMLWLAELHGVNGVRTIINDYTEQDSTRLILKSLLAAQRRARPRAGHPRHLHVRPVHRPRLDAVAVQGAVTPERF